MEQQVSRKYFILMVFLLFLSLANTLSIYSVDKIALIIFSVFFFFCSFLLKMIVVSRFVFVVLLFFMFFLSFLSLFSLDEVGDGGKDVIIILFFAFNLLLILLGVEKKYLFFIKVFIVAVSIYLIFGVAFWIYSVVVGDVYYVKPLYGKGMPSVYGALSFATTQQVFATFSALLLIVLYCTRRAMSYVKCQNFLLALCVISIVMSLNRVWILYLFLAFALWVGVRIWLAIIPLSAIGAFLLIFYWDVMFSLGTVDSRFLMMGHLYDFWVSQDFRHIFLGRPFYSGDYFFMHGSFFSYIESGPFFLLINFGLLGFCLVSLFFFWVSFRVLKVSIFLGVFCFYYLFFVQFMTQEFLSISFWLFWVVLFVLVRFQNSVSQGMRNEVCVDSPVQ